MKEPAPERLARASALCLTGLLFFATLMTWNEARWTVAVTQVGAGLAAMAWAARYVIRPFALRGSILLLPLGAAALWPAVQIAFHSTVYPHVTLEAALAWATNLALFALALQIFGDDARRRWMRTAMLVFGFGLSVVSTAQFFSSPDKVFWLFRAAYPDGMVGPFANRDHYAAFIELVLPLALYEALAHPRRMLWPALMAGAMFASVIAAASRAGAILVTVEVAALLIPALMRRGHGGMPWQALARVGACALAFTAVVGWEVAWDRFKEPDPFRYRREMLASAVEMAEARPAMGFGMGTFRTAYPGYASFDLPRMYVHHAHCDWAEWAAEGGLPMLALMLGVAAVVVWRIPRAPWAAGILAVFAHSLVDFPMQKPGLAAWVFVLLGAMFARRPQRSASE